MSADLHEPGQPEPGPAAPTSPQSPPGPQPPPGPQSPPGPQPPPGPQQPTVPGAAQPQAWPRPPAGPDRFGPNRLGAVGQEQYAVRPAPATASYEPYGYDQRPPEWAPLPMHDYQMQSMAVAPKSPALSVLLSVFIPGLGSMVNDNVGTGVAILLLNILGLVLSIVLIGIPLAVGTWIWGLVDAYGSAQRWNRAHGIIS